MRPVALSLGLAMKTLSLLLLALALALSTLAAQPRQKLITVGYDRATGCDLAWLREQLHDQVVATETFLAAHERSVTILLVPVRLAPAPLVRGELAVTPAMQAWAQAQGAAHPEVDYLILGAERSIRFSRLAQGIRINGLAGAYNLAGSKVCLMDLRLVTRNVFAHEFTHFLGYRGAAPDAVHATDEGNLMAAASLNQWGADEQLLRLWDAYIPVTRAQARQ